MPDATGLELLAQAVLERFGPGSVVATSYAHDLATLEIAPARVKDVVLYLRDEADGAGVRREGFGIVVS